MSVGGSSKCGGIGGGNCFAFQAPPSTARSLRGLGFDLVNMANNHSFDYGASGRAQTISTLNRAGVAHTGLPGEITVLRSGGRRVAFVGFAPYALDANLLDIPAAQALVRRARRRASLVVVIIHAGAEGVGALHTPHGSEFFVGENRGNPRAFAHAVIAAGASLVVGSGPHVIRGVERYRGRMIAYSLGNFVGYHTLAGGGVLSDSAILRVTLGARTRACGALDLDRAARRATAPRSRRRERSADDQAVARGLPARPLHGRTGRSLRDGLEPISQRLAAEPAHGGRRGARSSV